MVENREDGYLKLWPAVLDEFKRGSTKEDAIRNICSELGQDPPSYAEIHDWLQKYEDEPTYPKIRALLRRYDNNGLNDDDDDEPNNEIGDFHRNVLSAVIGQYLKFQSAIYFSDNWKFATEEKILCSRFMLVISRDRPKALSVIDSFTDERSELQGPNYVFEGPAEASEGPTEVFERRYVSWPAEIVNGRTLVHIGEGGSDLGLLLLEIDFDELKWTVLHAAAFDSRRSQPIMSSTDITKFLILDREFMPSISHAQIINDEIVMDNQRIEGYGTLWYPKLENDRICGFQQAYDEENDRRVWTFDEYVLELTSARKVNSVSCDFRRTNLSSDYVWSKDKLFVLVYFYGRKWFTVAAFDLSTKTWSRTNIAGPAFPASITVDDEDVLTIGTLDGDWVHGIQPVYKTVHRFPMRKPEKLSYLAWATIRRGHLFFGSDLHEKFASRLPLNSEFRPFSEYY